MIDLQQLKILAQLIDNLEIARNRFERAYNNNDAENFNNAKKEIFEIQNNISKLIE